MKEAYGSKCGRMCSTLHVLLCIARSGILLARRPESYDQTYLVPGQHDVDLRNIDLSTALGRHQALVLASHQEPRSQAAEAVSRVTLAANKQANSFF